MNFQRTLAGNSGSNIKSHNMHAILLALLQHGTLSRVRLAQMTGLSSTTITNLVAELLEEGLVTEEGPLRRRRVGRPRTALQLVPDARYALGIHIGVGSIRVTLTDLLAIPLLVRSFEHPLEEPAEAVLGRSLEVIHQVLEQSGVDLEDVVGLGVGASGLVDTKRGINVFAPNLDWHDVPMQEWFATRMPIPICVDNNVRAMALAEALFGKGRDSQVMAFVYVRIGVGAGIVVGHQLYHGSVAGAGEIGHTIIVADGGDPCRCGNTGCLETLISEPVMVRQAEKLAAQNPNGILATCLAKDEAPRIARVFEAAERGDTATRDMLEERACYMGLALANLVNVLNPDRIILGGLYAQGTKWLLPATQATLRQRAFADLGKRVQVEITGFGDEVGAIGAAALALNAFFYQNTETL
ncbi:MAG: ROK family transcriptional regulator [Anaerolineae bacterium]